MCGHDSWYSLTTMVSGYCAVGASLWERESMSEHIRCIGVLNGYVRALNWIVLHPRDTTCSRGADDRVPKVMMTHAVDQDRQREHNRTSLLDLTKR